MNTVFCKFCFVFIPLKSGELGAKRDQSRRTGEEKRLICIHLPSHL